MEARDVAQVGGGEGRHDVEARNVARVGGGNGRHDVEAREKAQVGGEVGRHDVEAQGWPRCVGRDMSEGTGDSCGLREGSGD